MPKFETSLAPHVMLHTLASTLLPENGPTKLSLADRMFVLQLSYAPKTSVAMTSDTSKLLKFYVNKQLSEQTFYKLGLMSSEHFQEVAWTICSNRPHPVFQQIYRTI